MVVKKTRESHKIIHCNPEQLRLEALLIFTITGKPFPCTIHLRFKIMLLAQYKYVGMLVCICLCHMQSKTRIPPALFSIFFYCTPPKSDQLLPRCCLSQMTALLKSELISSQGFVIGVVIFCYHLGGRIQYWQDRWPFVTLLMRFKHSFAASQWVGSIRDGEHSAEARSVALGYLCLVPLFNLSKN